MNYDFRALLREVESDYDCLLDSVVSILKQQYGDFGLWRQEAPSTIGRTAAGRLERGSGRSSPSTKPLSVRNSSLYR
jgi:hypothetical protein